MISKTLLKLYPPIKTYMWCSLIINMIGFKLFLDTGSYHIHKPFFMLHILFSMILAVALSSTSTSPNTAFWHTCTAWPTLLTLILYGNLPPLHMALYLGFLYSVQFSIWALSQQLNQQAMAQRLILLSLILWLWWGTPIIFHSISINYELIAPLTLGYHYELIQQGIIHISTFIYCIMHPCILWQLRGSND